MNKSELIKLLADTHPELPLRDMARVVDTVLDEITAALSQGQRVELRGFGSFDLRQRRARIGRNPRTGEQLEVPAKVVPHFKTGRGLYHRLNEGVDAGRR